MERRKEFNNGKDSQSTRSAAGINELGNGRKNGRSAASRKMLNSRAKNENRNGRDCLNKILRDMNGDIHTG